MFSLFDEEDPRLEALVVSPESPDSLYVRVLEYYVERLFERAR